MMIIREGQRVGAVRASAFTTVAAKQMASTSSMAPCGTICQPYSAQPGTPCGCKCMMYCAGK